MVLTILNYLNHKNSQTHVNVRASRAQCDFAFFRERENTKIIIFHINISPNLGDDSLLVVIEHITTVNDIDVHGSNPFNITVQ